MKMDDTDSTTVPNYRRPTLAGTLLIALWCTIAAAQSTSVAPAEPAIDERPWLNRELGVDERVAALLGEMTLAEKVGPPTQLTGSGGEPTGNADNVIASSALYERIRQG